MKVALRTKLIVSYMLLAIICVSLVSVLANISLEKHFRQYVQEKQESSNKEMVNLITQQYEGDGGWDRDVIKRIGINALEQGVIIGIYDQNGKMIWDANTYNNGMCQRMIQHMSNNMISRYPNWKGKYMEKSYPVYYKFKEVGKVKTGYYGPVYFSDRDLAFINTLNRILVGVGVVSLLFSIVFGWFMARRLSNPISRVINTAQMISQGHYGHRSLDKSNTKEISQLITAVNDLSASLEEQEKLRKRLTSDVAHELRTPLATLQSHLEAMIDGIWQPDVERLKSCHEEALRINRMVGQLAKLAKYERDNLALDRTQFDISELARNVIMNFESEYKNKNIDLQFQGEKQLVYADRDKISQVLVNLLSNALKYTPEGGKVEVYTGNHSGNIKISVKDNGLGIAPDDLPYIFERFYRADKSRNRMTGGAGIGLTIIKSIVEAHGGTIAVESRLNEGTEFIVLLPQVS